MRAVNHSLTGMFIGLVVGSNPVAAGFAAILSHYVCDALPHYGLGAKGHSEAANYRKQSFMSELVVDALLCFVIIVILVLYQPMYWQVAVVCAFLAAAPDFLWISKYQAAIKKQQYTPNFYDKWAARIQWFERPSGLAVEIAWAIAILYVSVPFFV